jgi:hypothetical protein
MFGPPSPRAAHATSKQLEAEKKYLEEELKQRGRGRQQHPAQNQDQTNSDSQTTSDSCDTATQQAVHNDKLTSDPVKLPLRKQRKEINILEDLDKENLFNASLPYGGRGIRVGRKEHDAMTDQNPKQASATTGQEHQPVSLDGGICVGGTSE